MLRYIAMQEIDKKVADIIADTGRDETDALRDLYGTFDDDDRSGVDSPRESLGVDHGQPTSPGYKPTGYGDEDFGWKQTETYNPQQNPKESSGANEISHVGRRNHQRGYSGQRQVSGEEGSMGRGGQQTDSGYDLQAFEELSISNDPISVIMVVDRRIQEATLLDMGSRNNVGETTSMSMETHDRILVAMEISIGEILKNTEQSKERTHSSVWF